MPRFRLNEVKDRSKDQSLRSKVTRVEELKERQKSIESDVKRLKGEIEDAVPEGSAACLGVDAFWAVYRNRPTRTPDEDAICEARPALADLREAARRARERYDAALAEALKEPALNAPPFVFEKKGSRRSQTVKSVEVVLNDGSVETVTTPRELKALKEMRR